jgi:RpiR family transcriptional regulator, carbohydrate utilization regulator
MIGISHTGMTDGVARALTLAGQNGAQALAITSDPSSPVAEAAQTFLTTWNSSTPNVHLHCYLLEGRISQIFLIDLLHVGLLFEKDTDRAQHLRVTADALKQHSQTGG